MRRLFSGYLVMVGVVANAALATLVFFWVSQKIFTSDAYRDVRRVVAGSLDGISVTPITPVSPGSINPGLQALPTGAWVKIHQLAGADGDSFERQAHGGAAFDPVRGRLMLFGSDTHRMNWDNTVRFFDMGSLAWSSAYPPDDPTTYSVNRDGIPVAGVAGDRPWAMHTFDAVEFDPLADHLIVASHPGHLGPDKSWGMDGALWSQIKKHPTWIYHVGENRWEPMSGKAVSFFPYAATFDPTRRRIIGVKPDGYWELSSELREWRRIAKGTPYAWHVAAAYDSDRDVVVVFGGNNKSDSVWQYVRGADAGKEMPTRGIRPPGAQSVPMVYHPGVKRIVALVENRSADSAGKTETWLYSTAKDEWTRLDGADVPFLLGMNYDMVYDPGHDLVVLAANMTGEPIAIWVLRLAE